ncbi:hypothetical protein TSAR_015519 [Trichomalopsis sarcophagae]|uniref:Uncharacterized protein n=1 Tax=Trichomalopsis sarcophagae TaxID=543379 RepID=A0A232F1U6_9HYME|nr:hypothetical protein TSAR_015519 [Trichomalopsis sarcophagae]
MDVEISSALEIFLCIIVVYTAVERRKRRSRVLPVDYDDDDDGGSIISRILLENNDESLSQSIPSCSPQDEKKQQNSVKNQLAASFSPSTGIKHRHSGAQTELKTEKPVSPACTGFSSAQDLRDKMLEIEETPASFN